MNLPKPGEPFQIDMAVGELYGKEESGPCRIEMPVMVDGKRETNVTTFWMFPLDPAGQEAVKKAGGTPHWNPEKSGSQKETLRENKTFLVARLDREKGWENWKRIGGEEIPYPGAEKFDEAVEMILGMSVFCDVLRFQAFGWAAAMVKADEGNSGDGSEKEAGHAGTQSKKDSDSPTQ